jgi:hypothetical protein
LAAVRDHIFVRRGNALRLLRDSKLGAFDLILAGGLCDYLSDRRVLLVLHHGYKALLHGGSLFFTNMARGNPYRLWMSYLADWQLIERSAEDIRHLITEAGVSTHHLTLETDQTALTLFAHITKPDQRNSSQAMNMRKSESNMDYESSRATSDQHDPVAEIDAKILSLRHSRLPTL